MAQLQLNGSKVLTAHLAGETVRAITGSMVAFDGQVSFKNAGMGGGDGFRAALKRKVAGESLALMECTGHGVVFFAVDAQDVTVVELNNETLQVESQQLLALDGQLRTDVAFTGLRGASSGQGLFTTHGHRRWIGGPALRRWTAHRTGGEPAVPPGSRSGRLRGQPRSAQPNLRHRRVVEVGDR